MIKSLLNKFKKNSITATAEQGLSPAITASIFNIVGARAIPSMPAAAQKAFQLAINPNAEAHDFIEVIESDEALSARVIKIANSVYFERGKKSETIEEAVTVIGMNELRCLLNATSLCELMPSKNPARTQIWSNDIATALISRALAMRIIPEKSEIAFLAGLMHDIGKLLLIQRAEDQYKKVLDLVANQGKDFCAAENEIFPFDHTEVGQLIAERWNFSKELTTIIRQHHQALKPEAITIEEKIAQIIYAADTISHALGLGHQKGFNKLRINAENKLLEIWPIIKIAPEEQKDFLNKMKLLYESEYDLYVNTGADNV